jgi:hypothetical protein
MGSLGMRLHQDCNAIGDAAKIFSRIPTTCTQNAILSLLIIRDCKASGDGAKISPHVSSTWVQNVILSLLIIHIIPSRQIYLCIDNPSLIPSIPCPTTSSYLWKYVRTADDVSHAENLQSNGCRCFSNLYKFRDAIQLPQFSDILVSIRANQYSTKAPSSFWSLILNSCCSYHGRCPLTSP